MKLGVGVDVHSGGLSRGITANIEGLSYAEFTGTFNSATDFQLIPEPSTYGLIGGAALAIGVLVLRRRRK